MHKTIYLQKEENCEKPDFVCLKPKLSRKSKKSNRYFQILFYGVCLTLLVKIKNKKRKLENNKLRNRVSKGPTASILNYKSMNINLNRSYAISTLHIQHLNQIRKTIMSIYSLVLYALICVFK